MWGESAISKVNVNGNEVEYFNDKQKYVFPMSNLEARRKNIIKLTVNPNHTHYPMKVLAQIALVKVRKRT